MIYFNNFSCVEDIVSNFGAGSEVLRDAEVLFASYGGRSYEGAAIVIYVLNGKMYEVHGSHCSCNGLEDQWNPEETSSDNLIFRYGTEDSLNYFKEEHGEEATLALGRIALNYEVEKTLLRN